MVYGYERNNDISSLKFSLIGLMASIILIIAIMCGTNACSSDKWNDGVCPKCDIQYELRAVASDLGLKYYVCPECKYEVHRY